MAYAGAPRTPGPDASHSCSFRMGASPRSSSPNTVGFFSMSSARGRFVGPSLRLGGKRQEAICAVVIARQPASRLRIRYRRATACESGEAPVSSAARARGARSGAATAFRGRASPPALPAGPALIVLSQSGSFTRRRENLSRYPLVGRWAVLLNGESASCCNLAARPSFLHSAAGAQWHCKLDHHAPHSATEVEPARRSRKRPETQGTVRVRRLPPRRRRAN